MTTTQEKIKALEKHLKELENQKFKESLNDLSDPTDKTKILSVITAIKDAYQPLIPIDDNRFLCGFEDNNVVLKDTLTNTIKKQSHLYQSYSL